MVALKIITEVNEKTWDSFTGTGPLSFDWAYFEKADNNVEVDGVLLAQSAWTVVGNAVDGGFDGGAITLNVAVASAKIRLYRDTPRLREAQFSSGGATPNSLNVEFNRLVTMAQDLYRDVWTVLGAVSTAALEAVVAGLGGKQDRVNLLVGLAAHTATAAGDVVFCTGRTSAGDGYEGHFRWVSGDQSANVTADPRKGIWVAPTSDATGASGAFVRVGQEQEPLELEPSWFKLAADTSDSPAFQAAIDFAIDLSLSAVIRVRQVSFATTVTIDISSQTADSIEQELPVIQLRGDGSGVSWIELDAATVAIRYLGGTASGVHSYVDWGGFTIRPNLFSGVAARATGTVGMLFNNAAYFAFEDIYFAYLDTGFDGIDVLSGSFNQCHFSLNNAHFDLRGGSYESETLFSHPNAIAFNDCIIAGSQNLSLLRGCANVVFNNGTIEGNGRAYTSGGSSGGAISLEDCGVQGGVALMVSGTYIEGNKGLADFVVDHSTAERAIYVITGSTFQRYSTDYVKTHISFTSSEALSRLVLIGNAFESISPYTDDSGRPYWEAGVGDVYQFANMLQDPALMPRNTLTPDSIGGRYTAAEVVASLDEGLFEGASIRVTDGTPLGNQAIYTSDGTNWISRSLLDISLYISHNGTVFACDHLPSGWTIGTSGASNHICTLTHNLGTTEYIAMGHCMTNSTPFYPKAGVRDTAVQQFILLDSANAPLAGNFFAHFKGL